MIESFLEGLKEGGVLLALKADLSKGLELLTHSGNVLTAEKLVRLFRRSPKLDKEGEKKSETIFANLIHFIDEIGEGEGSEFNVDDINLIEMNKPVVSQPKKLSLSDVLQFACGLRSITYADPIEIVCVESAQLQRVVADTCFRKVNIPMQDRYLDEELFTANFTQDIFDSPYFGRV